LSKSVVSSGAAASTRPLYAQIKEALRRQILDGRFGEHERMPTELQLTEQYAVSRITVRQALGDLERDGLIFRIHGKGSFVSKPKTTQDLSRLRGFGEAMTALGHATFNRVSSLKLVRPVAQVAAQMQAPAGRPMTELKRLRYLDGEPIAVELSYVDASHFSTLEKAELASRDLYDVLENDAGLHIGHAEIAIEARAASATVARDLRIDKGAPVLHLQRLTRDRDGRPIDHDLITFRGDAFRYWLKLDRS
jgi:GntR family transcriptional regulator